MLTRREMLTRCSTGFGMLALQGLMSNRAFADAVGGRKLKAKAKHVILCYMSGGVSQVDSFDPKPKLRELHGKPMPVKVERTQFNRNGNVMASPFEFKKHGQSGLEVSSMFPQLSTVADELAVIRSMTSKVNEHAQGNYAFHTGFPFMGHPSAGAWVSYGLGTENQNMPGFVVLQSGGASIPHGGVGLFSNGYLPAENQGSIIVGDRTPAVRNIRPGQARQSQRARLDFVKGLDQKFIQNIGGNNNVEAAVRNYETAFRMQSAVPELCGLEGETEATKKMYGMDSSDRQVAGYGLQCLLARRLVERGVRFIELSCLNGASAPATAPTRGINTATSSGVTGRWRIRWINRSPGSSRISRHAGCWTRRSSFGRVNLAGHHSLRAATAAITTRTATVSGWQAAEPRAAPPTGRPTSSAITSARTSATFTTCGPRCCT